MKEYTTGALYTPENTTRQARAYLDEHDPKPDAPSLYFVVGNHDETARLVEICGDTIHADPYDLLDSARLHPTRQKMRGLLSHPTSTLAREVLGVAIYTTGWASPLPADYEGDASSIEPPSQHPARRRVEVLAFEGWGGASANVRFDDDSENDLNGSGGVGSLADELSGLWDYLVEDTAESGTQPPVCYFCGTQRPIGAALHLIRTCPSPSVSPTIVRRFICDACERGRDD